MSFVRSVPETEESVAAVMKRYPEQGVLMAQLTEIVMRTGQCGFSSKERELIGAFASGVNACTYCFNTHKIAAEAFGVDESLLESLLRDIDNSPVD